MDYMFFMSLLYCQLIEILVSYDIACQWSINVWEGMKTYPHWMHIDHTSTKSFYFLIPKFHLPAHIMACQTIFSFNFNRFVGRTNGEAPECGWSWINPVATSTAEMGPGHRHDTLDNHFSDGNWKKTTTMGVWFSYH
jgi:Kyakuja-Dileera-Zisupton transposase